MDINPFYCASLPGYTYRYCGLKNTNVKLKIFQDKETILLLENNFTGGITTVMGDRYVISNENKKMLYFDANNIYGHSMSQTLPFDATKCDRSVKLEDKLTIPDESDNEYFREIDKKYSVIIKKKLKNFDFVQWKKWFLVILHRPWIKKNRIIETNTWLDW